MGFFNDAGKFFKKAARTTSSGFKNLGHDVEKATSTVYKDAKSVVAYGGKQIDKYTDLPKEIIDKGADTVKSLGGDVTSIAGSLSWPLIIAGGAVLLIVVMKK
jgi:hypothetical protein